MSRPAVGVTVAGPAPVIETERLTLREHRIGDYGDCVAIWSDPNVVRYIGGRTATPEEAWRRLLQYVGLWHLLGYGLWAVEEKQSGRYIGDIGYAEFKRDIEPNIEGTFELGWVLATQAQGKGYASEAVAAAIAWKQQHFPDRREVCIISPENRASIRVAEKAGFTPWQQTTYHGSPSIVFSR